MCALKSTLELSSGLPVRFFCRVFGEKILSGETTKVRLHTITELKMIKASKQAQCFLCLSEPH